MKLIFNEEPEIYSMTIDALDAVIKSDSPNTKEQPR